MAELKQKERSEALDLPVPMPAGRRLSWPRAALVLLVLSVIAWFVVIALFKWALR